MLGGVGDGCAEVYVPGGVLRPLCRVRQGSDVNVLPLWRGGDYASFLFSLLLASGMFFQAPLTPANVVSQKFLGVPLYLLFERVIVMGRFLKR